MRVIGLTGGVGTGKTTVSQMLQEFGAAPLDADKVGHQSYLPDSPAWNDLVAEFGTSIIQPNREIDRRKLGGIVFGDATALSRLNSIVHPRMRAMIQILLQDLEKQGVQVVVLEAAVLIEAKWVDLTSEVWVTDAPEDTVVRRLAARSAWPEEQARARIAAQLPRSDRLAQAQVVINTDCSIEDVRKQVEIRWQECIGRLE